jgi:hypothetical protein
MMEAAGISQTSVNFYYTARRKTPTQSSSWLFLAVCHGPSDENSVNYERKSMMRSLMKLNGDVASRLQAETARHRQ